MDSVGINAGRKLGANRTRCGLARVSCPHEFTIAHDCVLALQRLDHHGSGCHKVHKIGKKRALAMDRIEAFSFFPTPMLHFSGDDLETCALETNVDIAYNILGYSVRLDDGKRAFHGVSLGAMRNN